MHISLNISIKRSFSFKIIFRRFDIRWLKPEYRDKRSEKYQTLDEKSKRVIDGVHNRDFKNGSLPADISPKDYEVLNKAYGKSMFKIIIIDFYNNNNR